MQTFSAPGRAEVLGNHTDYNNGLVLSLAIDRDIKIHAKKRKDRKLIIIAKDINQSWKGDLDNLTQQTEMTWVNYVLGVLDRLEQIQEVKLCGAEMEITSTIPIGAGLSSSAALEAVTLIAALSMNKIEMDELEMAKLCQWAEQKYSGVQCGLLDQMSVISSKERHLNYLDFSTFKNTPQQFQAGYKFIIVNSKVSHSLADGEYNERRESCEKAAEILGVDSLRNASLKQLENQKEQLGDLFYRRALHVIGEISRVTQALEHMRSGDLESFGTLMFQSHQSSVENFENSCPELDLLVKFSKAHDGCLGARLSGGGFGGATINLVKEECAEQFTNDIKKYYMNQTGKKPTVLITSLASGALERK